MDKSWMYRSRASREYLEGVKQFLQFAFFRKSQDNKILCPCKCCVNRVWLLEDAVYEHLVCQGFTKGYTHWVLHGEGVSSTSSPTETTPVGTSPCNDMGDLLNDLIMGNETDDFEGSNPEADKFYKLVEDGNRELYPGCKSHSKLSFIVRLFLIKCQGNISNKAFNELLQLVKEALPECDTLPTSIYETKKFMAALGLGYEKIDACRNDCMLFRKEHANDSECHICGASRWKEDNNQESTPSRTKARKISSKILRYFPLKPRLQRLFMSSKTATLMRWHHENRTKDGLLHHPADSPAWQSLDFAYQDFSGDPRNIRLGLAADGFNPFRTMSLSHSTWPVILIPYNLPPWLCMKQPYLLLSLLIPGPTAPGNNIDVYLQPLIDELIELWEVGVNTYDASLKNNFNLRATLLWTINDFPAYANLSGWSTKGSLACPCCHKHTHSRWLKHCRKFCYMGSRRFLPRNHVLRCLKRSFDNNQEFREKPRPMTGEEVLAELEGTNLVFGKMSKNSPLPYGWKKKSIFFQLPYWKCNLLRHNLDVMHIEKNVCDNVLGTILNLRGKSKDSLKARLDMKVMDIRPELHPIDYGNNKTFLPPACFTLSSVERKAFCKLLKNVKVPDGFAANISRCVDLKNAKIAPLKSHDCHILMQNLLPLALQKVLPKQVKRPLIRLCSVFKGLCSKVCRVSDMNRLESQATSALCQLEKIFPPSFFDVMVHLTLHLVSEAKLGGPVQFRWMYPIERFLLTLKSYVRNRNYPEGSIAEGYLAEECVNFCSLYLEGIYTRHNRTSRNDDELEVGNMASLGGQLSVFCKKGRPLGNGQPCTLDNDTWVKVHRYILNNCELVTPFIERHLAIVKHENPRANARTIKHIHNKKFPTWFSNQVQYGINVSQVEISEELRHLARGPSRVGIKYTGFIVNGARFHTNTVEKKRKYQNSGVVVTANIESFASARDSNPISGNVTYYGILKEVLEVEYWIGKSVVLFDCDWVSTRTGLKEDEFGFTLVNFDRLMGDAEPFILASQAEQVFYVGNPTEANWKVAVRAIPRDYYNMNEESCVDDFDVQLSQSSSLLESTVDNEVDSIQWIRDDVDGILVDVPFATTTTNIEDDQSGEEEVGEDEEL